MGSLQGLAWAGILCEMYGGHAEPNWMVQASTELAALNAADGGAFVAALGGIFENAPWVAERASICGRSPPSPSCTAP